MWMGHWLGRLGGQRSGIWAHEALWKICSLQDSALAWKTVSSCPCHIASFHSGRGSMHAKAPRGKPLAAQISPPSIRQPGPKKWPSEKPEIVAGRRLGRPDMQKIKRIRVRSVQAAQAATNEKLQVVKKDIWENDALSHTSGFQILFLGTGTGGPHEQRRSGCLALKLARSCWLFDCGEDTQRQVHKQPLIRNGKLERIFVTNCRPENLLGLPGMLCTMSGSREIGLDSSDMPLHIYGPPGLADFIGPMLKLSGTFISMPVIIHEFVDHAVDPELTTPQQMDKRSCLFRVLLPPDKLNPKGYHDGKSGAFLSRGNRASARMAKGEDVRVNHRDLPLPPPGDPKEGTAEGELLTWTILTSTEHSMTACRAPASVETIAYVWREADRVGALDPEQCDRLQVKPSERGFLKAGMSVTSLTGSIVEPSQVLGEDIKGRKVAIVGETNNSTSLSTHLQDCDAIIHAASCMESNEKGMTQHKSCIDQAASLTAASKSSHLILYRFKPGGGPTESFTEEPVNIASSPAASPKSTKFESLNYTHNNVMVRRETHGGYIWSAKHTRQTVPTPSSVSQAAEHFAEGIIGREHSVSLADDMDLYSIERNMPDSQTA